ncbi:hypothetical protein L6452_28051 [Arctium lappa]|uniref:Uncharacterized protein n=1 Tax=Arctium lappa TaxID=4217 RepID=A0ACB8ZWU0_ARCLA|nr:hypothetical protein L6452_28051 [Arctium lappa]
MINQPSLLLLLQQIKFQIPILNQSRLMEQVFDSEESSSSGCESGWTLYLQHDDYSIPHDLKPSVADHAQHHQQEEEEEEDDDDMSMVSDASSGPPHFQQHQEHEDDEYSNNNDGHVFCHPPLMIPRKRRKILEQTSFHSHRVHLQDHLPDHDTASSPFFTTKDLKVCNKEDDNSFGYSQGHSTTYFEPYQQPRVCEMGEVQMQQR